VIDAVVFDLDGVLLETEELWDEVREALARERGGRYGPQAQRAMMGMSSLEWSRYMRDEVGVGGSAEEISAEVVRRLEARYRERLPLLPGAVEAVGRIAARWPLGLASSSNRRLIEVALELAAIAPRFGAVVSSEEVARGKPSPDVYLEAARRLGLPAARCAAVEDSHSGIRAAKAAGMRVIAIPNRTFPPDAAALADADLVLDSIAELTPAAISATSQAGMH
jgi:HAD superfamily hydrolase (TIGR01509 family)